ncbi:MAG TPA: DUF3299 domain-containing protein [Verrucomicrobiae bacterium]|jgi:hypothetical protein|nr:DUF3299 domain-containing protein [Verrucomicrobiae bacterium]
MKTRRNDWLVLLLLALWTLVAPMQMRAQVVRGEKISFGGPAVITNIDSVASSGTNSSSTNAPEFMVSDGEKYRMVSFAQLSSFTFTAPPAPEPSADPATPPLRAAKLPDVIRALNDKSVAVTGFMLPTHTDDGRATDFLLLRNQSACCYGVLPKINEWVVVRTSGKGVKAVMDVPVTVLGTLHVGELVENGQLSGIYELDCDRLSASDTKP